MKKLLLAAALLVSAIALLIALIAAHAYAAAILWSWFIVPIGIQAISFTQMIGIFAALSVFRPIKYEEEPDAVNCSRLELAAKRLFYPFLKPVFALVIGWVIKNFVI